ncbi:Nickel-dependent lactate racemase [Paenibacillus sp. GP183]|nr:Nickel-dependent lactate racemase [Paenibacillus sp. GP183]
MIIYLLPYGKGTISFDLPNGVDPDWINYHQKNNAPGDWLSMALENPIDSKRLQQAAAGSRSAVILISDMSRLSPSYLFAGRLLDELNAAGIRDEQIRIIVALGSHRKQTEEELISLTGLTAYKRVQVLNHSALPEDCIAVGVSRAGTPIEINRHVVEAEFRIVTGNIEPHRLAGVSGGVKALMPGVASTRTIEHNHSLSQMHKAEPGQPDNPLRLDMEEALRFVPIHFLLNVIVDHERNVLDAFAGDVIAAHRAGIEAARSRFIVEAPHLYDVVLVSAGGHPKDTQLYQALKALTNAAAITRPGGSLVLVAQCEELFGNGIFQHWVETIGDRQIMLAKLKEKFVLGAHKIEHIDSILQHHPVYLFSQMPEALVRLMGFHPVSDLNHTLSLRLEQSGRNIAVMPYGGLTYPYVQTMPSNK